MKKVVLSTVALTSVLILGACGKDDALRDIARSDESVGSYANAVETLEKAIDLEPENKDYIEELAQVKSDYAQRIITSVQALNASTDVDSIEMRTRMLQLAFELDPTLTETSALEKATAEKQLKFAKSLEKYAKWLSTSTKEQLALLSDFRASRTALTTGVMSLQEFNIKVTNNALKMQEIVESAEKAYTTTTGTLVPVHQEFVTTLTGAADELRTILSLINQGEIDANIILEKTEQLDQIPGTYAVLVQKLSELGEEYKIDFPEEIDEEVFANINKKSLEKEIQSLEEKQKEKDE